MKYYLHCIIKEGEMTMINLTNEILKGVQGKVCPECGQMVQDHVETYLLECDRCLSKKAE